MAYKEPEYPADLTKKHWDKNKSLSAKIAGETGVGAAAAACEAAFKKVEWGFFDAFHHMPRLNNPAAYKEVKEYEAQIPVKWKEQVKPVIDELKKLKTTAQNAAKKLGENPKLKKDKELADHFAVEGDKFSVTLQLNSVLFDDAAKVINTKLEGIKNQMEGYQKIAAGIDGYLTELLEGLKEVLRTIPSAKTALDIRSVWDLRVKQKGRSVCNDLKLDVGLAKGFLKLWTDRYLGFDWEALKFSEDLGQLRLQLKDIVIDINKEAVPLRKALNK